MNEYILVCRNCRKPMKSNDPCIGEVVICQECAEITKTDFLCNIDKFYQRVIMDNTIDDILKKAVREYDSKSWYQRIRDYIKKNITILRS